MRDYLDGEHMTAGFALVAFPAIYGDSGVMTFLVGEDGVVYQKNLGHGTKELAAAIDAYDPDATWQKVP